MSSLAYPKLSLGDYISLDNTQWGIQYAGTISYYVDSQTYRNLDIAMNCLLAYGNSVEIFKMLEKE